MLAEYFYSKVNGRQSAPFGWHNDSVVLYYEKSDSIGGGDLHYKENDEEHCCYITANKERGIAQLALFDCDVEHCVCGMTGKGVRQSVSFFIEKI